MTSHVNIYFSRRSLQKSSLANTADFPFCIMLESIFFLYCELSRLRTRGFFGQMRIFIHSDFAVVNLILRNLPSNTVRYSAIIHSREKSFLNDKLNFSLSIWIRFQICRIKTQCSTVLIFVLTVFLSFRICLLSASLVRVISNASQFCSFQYRVLDMFFPLKHLSGIFCDSTLWTVNYDLRRNTAFPTR